jgi:hypothetical protein
VFVQDVVSLISMKYYHRRISQIIHSRNLPKELIRGQQQLHVKLRQRAKLTQEIQRAIIHQFVGAIFFSTAEFANVSGATAVEEWFH